MRADGRERYLSPQVFAGCGCVLSRDRSAGPGPLVVLERVALQRWQRCVARFQTVDLNSLHARRSRRPVFALVADLDEIMSGSSAAGEALNRPSSLTNTSAATS